MNRMELPAFATEAEEAAWWYDNREEHDRDFVQAIEEGRVSRSSLAQRLAAANDGALVKVAEQDAAAAKLLAEKRGVPVSVLLSDLLHAAIQQEIDRAA